jgi:DNA-binding protein HU-beta
VPILRSSRAPAPAILDSIKQTLSNGEKVSLFGLGTLTPIVKAARKGRNPRTGEEIDIKEKKTVKFKVSSTYLNDVN